MAGLLGGSKPAAKRYNQRAMPRPAASYDRIREMQDAYNHRLRLVDAVRPCGIKAPARFAQRIPTPLHRCGSDLRPLAWQTDNGSELIGELPPDGSREGFPRAVRFFGSPHQRIPPLAPTYPSDVETVHRLLEDEFFEIESFSSPCDFLAQASLDQLSCHLARPHSHKNYLRPWQIFHPLDPRLPLRLCWLPPLPLAPPTGGIPCAQAIPTPRLS